MPDLADGETTEMKGSGAKPYVLKNTGGVYSCTCPAWRNQNAPIERRTCKHLRRLRGDTAEEARLGGALPQKPVKKKLNEDGEEVDAGPPLLLAESWDNAADLAGWWMSEKLDGVRAYWDGSQFLSRLGNLFHAPDWFIDGLPEVPLDGELWIDRKKFQRTVSIVRRQDKCDLWSEVQFLVFDAPGIDDVFERRVAFIQETLGPSRKKPLKFAQPHEHQLCKDLDCLRAELARVEALGGEGLMLRQPQSKYEAGRSSTLLKVKRFHDAEAVVTGHQDGLGRHKGRLGALLVKLPNGIAFSVGTGFSDRERGNPPPIGATITFRYQELSEAGVPRFPSYVGVRIDAPAPARPATVIPVQSSKKEVDMASAKTAKTKVPTSAAASKPTAAPAPAPAPAKKSTGGDKPRHFEFVEGTSSKFWEITRSGCDVTTHWGRIGTDGQSKTKTFADEAAATKEYDKLVEEKTGKGYVET